MTTKAPAAPAAKDLRDRRPYRVTAVRAGLYIPIDDDIERRRKNGEDIPLPERKFRFAPTGEIVRDMLASSVPSLLANGWIEPVEDAPTGEKAEAR